jgi:hypothetical protein
VNRNTAFLVTLISLAGLPVHGAATLKGKIWPAENRPIPYILPRGQFSAPTFQAIQEALSALRVAGVPLRKIESPKDSPNKGWVRFASPAQPKICNATAGYRGKSEHVITIGRQCRNLGQQQTQRGEVLHEILHVLGFIHEHQRRGGEDFVIIDRLQILFSDRFSERLIVGVTLRDEYLPEVFKEDEVELHGSYDLFSVMHYVLDGQFLSARDKSLPGCCDKVGLRNELSELDRRAIRTLYAN